MSSSCRSRWQPPGSAPVFARRRASEPRTLSSSPARPGRADLFVTNDERLNRFAVPGVHFMKPLERAPL